MEGRECMGQLSIIGGHKLSHMVDTRLKQFSYILYLDGKTTSTKAVIR